MLKPILLSGSGNKKNDVFDNVIILEPKNKRQTVDKQSGLILLSPDGGSGHGKNGSGSNKARKMKREEARNEDSEAGQVTFGGKDFISKSDSIEFEVPVFQATTSYP